MNSNDNNNQTKVLIVEDDRFIAKAYADGLKRVGCEVDIAYNGFEAIEKVKAGKPGLIILDLILPGIDGFGVLEQLRQTEGLKDTPILVLSNLSQSSDIEKAKELGATDYLTKAKFSMKEIVNKVQEHLGK